MKEYIPEITQMMKRLDEIKEKVSSDATKDEIRHIVYSLCMKTRNVAQEVFPNGGRARINEYSRYIGSSGEVIEGSRKWVESYEKIDKSVRQREADWVKQLRAIGIKAAHPDDGWHKREERYFGLSYPYFKEELAVGDMVALGDPGKFVVVIITKIGGFLSRNYYYKSTIY